MILPDIYGTYIAQNHQVMFEENLLVVIYDFFCSVYFSLFQLERLISQPPSSDGPSNNNETRGNKTDGDKPSAYILYIYIITVSIFFL